MARRFFIDAMNVVRTNVSLAKAEERNGPVTAGRELLRLVRVHAGRVGGEWIVVFDGPADEADRTADEAVQTIYAEDRSADEVIIERAEDALAVGNEVTIVSNDGGLRVEGAKVTRTEDFYAALIQRPRPADEEIAVGKYAVAMGAASKAGADTARRIAARLADLGHLPPAAPRDAELVAELGRLVGACAGALLPQQKAAQRIETFLRRKVSVRPDPDPQRMVLRALKGELSK